jgi:hypothetical protein
VAIADQNWITFDVQEGDGDERHLTTVKVTAAKNEGAARETEIKITAGGAEKSFTVKQD